MHHIRPKIRLIGTLAAACCIALVGSCSFLDGTSDTPDTVLPASTSPSKIAITIDDLPYAIPSRTTPQEGLSYVRRINETLKDHKIAATGFVVGQNVTNETTPALQTFADAGHTIGNHSWSHPDYGTLTQEQFRAETRRTDRILSKWITNPRYYRFPFLREGETEEAKTAATQTLADLGYKNVPVTIDNDEWKFNADYLDAIAASDTNRAERISDQYLAHMQERTAHFQRLANDALGRDVNHILLIHMNKINADHLDRLLEWYVSEGWVFISVKEALTDGLYSAPDLYAGARGLSQIERVIGRKSE